MSFTETRLDLGILYGTQGGPRFNTEVLENSAGYEQRIARSRQGKARWVLGNKILDSEELDYLSTFFEARKGKEEGFRFKDWTDFRGKNELLGTGDGITEKYQLLRWYGDSYRVISKPVAETVTVTVEGATVGWYSIDTSTGVVTFDSPPDSDAEIRASFEFDVPVRFQQDELSVRLEASDREESILELQELSIVEIRVPLDEEITLPAFSPDITALKSELFNLNLETGEQAIIPQSVGGGRFKTTVTEIDSGFERRDRAWSNSRAKFNLGDVQLNLEQWKYLREFFWERKGKAIGFQFADPSYKGGQPFLARFDQDELAVRFDAYYEDEDDPVLFVYLSGLKIVELTTETENNSYNGLQGDSLFQATCWRLERKDGVVLGFTNHDFPIDIDGLRYQPETGASANAVSRNVDLSQDNSKLESILDSSAITEADIIGGRYDEAIITEASINYLNPPNTLEEGIVLVYGEIGEISNTKYRYTAEIVGLDSLLNRSVSVTTAPVCRATFGDASCKKDLSSLTWTNVSITNVISSETIEISYPSGANEELVRDGFLVVESGDNEGFSRDIRSVNGSAIALFEPLPFALTTNDTIKLVAGCNKTFASCEGYNNIENFQGIPTHGNFAPNSDWILSSPRDNDDS